MEKKCKVFKRISGIIMTILIMSSIFVCLGNTSQARNRIDTSKKGTLRLSYRCDITEDDVNNPTPVSGVRVHLYRVASVNEAGFYTWTEPYSDIAEVSATNINKISSADEWNALLVPVKTYIYTNGIKENASGTSDSDGLSVISGLELGVYLVLGDTLEDKANNCTYTFAPFFTAIPTIDPETDTWVYDNGDEYVVDVSAKCEYYLNPKEVEYNLYKNWVDNGMDRPGSIEVKIYLDGDLYQTVTLSTSNNWHYFWTYKEGHSFTISEAVPAGYTVSYSQSGNVFTMTNTGDDTPPTTPPDPENPKTPDNPVEEVLGAVRLAITEDDTPDVLGATRLPQTGQIWWPVFALALIGIGFFTVGFITDKKD